MSLSAACSRRHWHNHWGITRMSVSTSLQNGKRSKSKRDDVTNHEIITSLGIDRLLSILVQQGMVFSDRTTSRGFAECKDIDDPHERGWHGGGKVKEPNLGISNSFKTGRNLSICDL